MAQSLALPTLSQIESWRVDHLEAAADEWARQADTWETAYRAVAQEVTQPGGASWDGAAAEAAAQRVTRDRRTASGGADALNNASSIARAGAADIRVAQEMVREKIRAAHAARFSVEDDLTIVDTAMSPLSDRRREAIAMRHAVGIWTAADALAATDRTVAKRLVGAIDGLESLQFSAEPREGPANILLAGFGGSLPPLPSAPHLIYCYPSARPDFWWCEGYAVGGGPYGFDSPIDVSGVG